MTVRGEGVPEVEHAFSTPNGRKVVGAFECQIFEQPQRSGWGIPPCRNQGSVGPLGPRGCRKPGCHMAVSGWSIALQNSASGAERAVYCAHLPARRRLLSNPLPLCRPLGLPSNFSRWWRSSGSTRVHLVRQVSWLAARHLCSFINSADQSIAHALARSAPSLLYLLAGRYRR